LQTPCSSYPRNSGHNHRLPFGYIYESTSCLPWPDLYLCFQLPVCFVQSCPDKQEGAYLSIIAGLIVLLSVICDLLNYYSVIDTINNVSSIGLLCYLLSISIILSKRFSLAIARAEILSAENARMIEEISGLNQNLEERITQRTAQ